MKKGKAKYIDLILKVLPYITDLGQLVGRRDASVQVLGEALEDVREEISSMHEHMDKMYIGIRKELGDIRFTLNILIATNVLVAILLILVLIRVW